MPKTKKRQYDRYTLAFKRQAVRLSDHPNVTAKDVAESLGLHGVMLYRWRMEHRKGELREIRYVSKGPPSPKGAKKRVDPAKAKDDELNRANKRIKALEKALAVKTEELDLLKKAQRFFEKTKR
jgi:transposase